MFEVCENIASEIHTDLVNLWYKKQFEATISTADPNFSR